MNTSQTYKKSLALLGAASIGFSGQVYTQQAAAAVLEETVVTAQKREQSLQDVPAAVEAFGSEAIANAGWKDVGGLQEAVPALEIGGESKMRPFVFYPGDRDAKI